MTGIEIFLIVDGNDVADGLVHQKLFDLLGLGVVARVETHQKFLAVLLFGVQDGLRLLLVGTQGLLGENVLAQLHGADDVGRVRRVGDSDQDQVGVGFLHHLIEVHVGGCVGAHELARHLHALAVDVAESHQGGHVTVVLDQVAAPVHAAASGAHLGDADFRFRLRGGGSGGGGQGRAAGGQKPAAGNMRLIGWVHVELHGDECVPR